MRKRKRMLAMGLVMALTVSATWGCSSGGSGGNTGGGGNAPTEKADQAGAGTETGQDEPSEGKTVIRFWGHQNEAWQIAYEEMIAKFEEAYPEYDVQSEYFPYADYQTKIQTSLMAKGDGADVYAMWGGWALDFAGTGALAEVPEQYQEILKNDFYDPAVAAYRYDGKYYGVPMEYNLEYGGMLVNKRLFDEAGLAYPTTWEEVEQVSDQVSKSNGNVMEMRGFDFVSGDSLPFLWLGMILSQGGEYLKEDGSVDFNSDIAVSTMEKLRSYVVDRKWTNMDTLTQGTSAYRMLYEGKSFMHPIGCWAVSNGEAAYGLSYGEDYDYLPLPKLGDEIRFAAETGWGLAVPKDSNQKEGAWKFVEFFTEPDNLAEFNIACAQLPPRKSMLGNEEFLAAMPYAQCLLDILEGGQWIGPYNTETFKGEINAMFVTLCTTDEYSSVEQALAQLTDTINRTKLQ